MFKLITFFLIISFSINAQTLQWQNIVPQTDASFRGLSVVDDSFAWVSGSKGWVGRSTNGGNIWSFQQLKGYEKCDFRSVYAFDKNNVVIANAGSPAFILVTHNAGTTWTKVYQDDDSLAFFDGIDFWNKKSGIIYGDPKDGHINILKTSDGGQTWHELPQKSRPAMAKGEASFAASGTTIRCSKHGGVAIATGGAVSRLLVSENRGRRWKSLPTPIIQGQSTTGIFSFACWNKTKMVIVGGDYKQDTLRKNHIFCTKNGGKQWFAPTAPTRGYRECVNYINKQTLLATGPTGSDISYNGGENWQPANDEKQFHCIKKARKGTTIIAAGGAGKIAIVVIL